MRYAEALRPRILEVLPKIKLSTDEELANLFWQTLLDSESIQGFGGGDRKSRIREWFSKTLEEAIQATATAGLEMKRLFEKEETIDDVEGLTLLISFVVVMIPATRDWPVAEILALIAFELRRRHRGERSQ